MGEGRTGRLVGAALLVLGVGMLLIRPGDQWWFAAGDPSPSASPVPTASPPTAEPAASGGATPVPEPTTASPAALPGDHATGSGVYCGGQDDSCVTSFEGWRGAPAGAVGTFLPRGTWDDIEIPGWWLDIWRDSPYRDRLVVTIGMLPDNGEWGGLDEGADGEFDEHFRVAAERLVAAGLGSAWIRPGHELNGGWYRWSARADPEAYAEYYRRIVTAMRSVPGADFRFDWNVAVGGDQHMDAREAYPGDEYVDAVGVDVYDSAWNMPGLTPEQRWDYLVHPDPGQGLQFWADFAQQQGKPLAFAEWGLVGEGSAMAGDGGAGGDNPEYVERMHEWFAAHPLAYELYFDRDAPDGTHVISSSTTLFPQGAQRYRALFG